LLCLSVPSSPLCVLPSRGSSCLTHLTSTSISNSMSSPANMDVVQQEESYQRKFYDNRPSCMSLFDQFLSCNVLAAQLKSVYRHGHMSSCQRKLDDFKFYFSTRSLSAEQRCDVWIRRRAEWWAGRSSKDVWEVRTCVSNQDCLSPSRTHPLES
jgi:Protein of unknown function (DUF3128)